MFTWFLLKLFRCWMPYQNKKLLVSKNKQSTTNYWVSWYIYLYIYNNVGNYKYKFLQCTVEWAERQGLILVSGLSRE